MTKAYSRNEEDFHEDLNDVLDDLERDGYLEVGTPLWEGEIKRPTGAAMCFGVVDQVIDQIQSNAFEEADEHAGDWPNLPKEKLAELGDLIANWIDTNAPPHFFTVQNVKQIEVTAEMLADYQGVPTAGVPGLPAASDETRNGGPA
jgi:hypothetical protein